MSKTKSKSLWRGATAAAAAVALVLAAPLSASADTTVNAVYGGAQLTVAAPVAGVVSDGGTGWVNGIGSGTVTLSGTGYDGQEYGPYTYPVGIYYVYGPKEADFNTNSGWYLSAGYIPGSLLTSGNFSGKTLNIAKTYTAQPYHNDPPITVDCEYDDELTYAQNKAINKYKCYLQTFTAHGVEPTDPGTDEAAIEVRW